MKRTPLRRKTPLRPIGKRRKRVGVPADVYALVVGRDGVCQGAQHLPGLACWGRLDPHHILRKSQGGPDTVENLVLLCRGHHDYVHGNPAWARTVGLLRSP